MKKDKFSEPITTRQTPFIVLFRVILFTMFFNILFIATSIVYAYLGQYFEKPTITEATLFIALFIFEISIFIILITKWFSEYTVVDEHFLLHKTGIFFTKEARYKLDTINSVDTEQNPFNKVLRYGNIKISHSNNEVLIMRAIPYPNQFVYLVEQKIETLQKNLSKENIDNTF